MHQFSPPPNLPNPQRTSISYFFHPVLIDQTNRKKQTMPWRRCSRHKVVLVTLALLVICSLDAHAGEPQCEDCNRVRRVIRDKVSIWIIPPLAKIIVNYATGQHINDKKIIICKAFRFALFTCIEIL